jgi:hypothetical protein
MSTTADVPCIDLRPRKPLKITLPFGAKLTSMGDISKGPPSDCTLIHSLILQLAPALAGLECILKMLKFLAVVGGIKGPQDLGKLADAAKDLAQCFNFGANIPCMLVDILKLIIAYLLCIIQAVESILKFQIGIDFSAADGNPVLLASLDCAKKNGDASMAQIREALQLIQPLFAVIDSMKGLATAPIPGAVKDALTTVPKALAALKPIIDGDSFSAGIPGVEDTIKTLDDIKSKLQLVQAILDEVPC